MELKNDFGGNAKRRIINDPELRQQIADDVNEAFGTSLFKADDITIQEVVE